MNLISNNKGSILYKRVVGGNRYEYLFKKGEVVKDIPDNVAKDILSTYEGIIVKSDPEPEKPASKKVEKEVVPEKDTKVSDKDDKAAKEDPKK